MREIPKHNCLKRWHNEVMNLVPDQPCKVRKTTEDKYCDHEQKGDGILVSADGLLVLKMLLGDDEEFHDPISTQKATTSKDGAKTIEEQNRELTTRPASLE